MLVKPRRPSGETLSGDVKFNVNFAETSDLEHCKHGKAAVWVWPNTKLSTQSHHLCRVHITVIKGPRYALTRVVVVVVSITWLYLISRFKYVSSVLKWKTWSISKMKTRTIYALKISTRPWKALVFCGKIVFAISKLFYPSVGIFFLWCRFVDDITNEANPDVRYNLMMISKMRVIWTERWRENCLKEILISITGSLTILIRWQIGLLKTHLFISLGLSPSKVSHSLSRFFFFLY